MRADVEWNAPTNELRSGLRRREREDRANELSRESTAAPHGIVHGLDEPTPNPIFFVPGGQRTLVPIGHLRRSTRDMLTDARR